MKKKTTIQTPDLFSMSEKKKLKAGFYEALTMLNEGQREAVESIEGPVMVLAGPGTGKTQVLAARYGNILETTDVSIRQILCLTYSEAGVQAMRDRLFQFIGPASHEAHIFTYHAFCNKVIQENPEYFFDYKKFRLASDLQRYELIEKILLELPDDHVLQRLIGDRHWDIKRLASQYDSIKKEQRDLPKLIEGIRQHIELMDSDPDYRYKRPGKSGNKGDLRPTYYQDKARYERAIDALKTFDTYASKMAEQQWMDFNDMLLQVQHAFKEHPDLLARYQENYQYFLVDEFQDTNVIQNNVLLSLCDYWEQPNLFVVGDDDQAIYRFQGADQQNLVTILTRYPDIRIICITENYRSTQSLLDAADAIIEPLEERIHKLELEIPPQIRMKINKKLVATRGSVDDRPPDLRVYQNPQQETLALYEYIRKIWETNPGSLGEHAVIFRRNKTVQDLVYLLELSGIPINFRSTRNLLEEPLIRHLVLLLEYLQAEFLQKNGGEPYLIQLMYLPYWGLDPHDVSTMAWLERKSRDNKNLAGKILDSESWPEAGFKNRTALAAFISSTREWIESLPPVQTLSLITEDILRKSGMLTWALNSIDRNWHLRAINSFLAMIRNEVQENPAMDMTALLDRIHKMENFGIYMPLESQYAAEQGINLLTAHGSKGKEFESVWIMNVLAQDWEDYFMGGEQPYKIPDGLKQLEQSKASQKHDERRLFYVSMTRAKKSLVVSWSSATIDQKPLRESVFASELRQFLNSEPPIQQVDESLLIEKFQLIQNKKSTPPELLDHDLISQYCSDFVMSSTDLDKYLECPRRFYFEEILRTPQAPNAHIGLGIAVHEALFDFFNAALKAPGLHADYLVDFFLARMKKHEWYFTRDEYEGLVRRFTHQLPLFYKQHQPLWEGCRDHRLEYFLDRLNFENVPIHGKLDQVLVKDGNALIVDFKSGRGDSTSSKDKLKVPHRGSLGGNYWRQACFYKILLDRDPNKKWNTTGAQVIFLQVNKLDQGGFLNKEFLFNQEELDIVGRQIADTNQKIRNHEFDLGCEKPECEWCSFIKHRDVILRRQDAERTDT